MGPRVRSTACLMMTACTDITRVMNVTEVKSAGLAGKAQAVLIENRSENAVLRRTVSNRHGYNKFNTTQYELSEPFLVLFLKLPGLICYDIWDMFWSYSVPFFSVLFDIYTYYGPHRYACYNNKQIQLT